MSRCPDHSPSSAPLAGTDEGACLRVHRHLYGTDGVTQVAENDEASLEGFETIADVDWTCPADGVYYILLRMLPFPPAPASFLPLASSCLLK